MTGQKYNAQAEKQKHIQMLPNFIIILKMSNKY